MAVCVASSPIPAHLRAKIPPVATVADPIATGIPRGVAADMRNPPYGIEDIGEMVRYKKVKQYH